VDYNCKPVHACAYTVPRSLEQQSQHSKEIARLVGIGVLEEENSSELAFSFQSFPIPRKKGTIIIVVTWNKF
jgi:hypothetical protein